MKTFSVQSWLALFCRGLVQNPRITIGWLTDQSGVYRRFTIAGCGHRTHIFGSLTAFDDKPGMAELLKTSRWCFECLNQLAIPCAWCGGSIYPGQAITLYSAVDPSFVSTYPLAVRYREEPVTYVGCLRPSCTDGGDFHRSGIWNPPNGVRRTPSVVEMLMANPGKGVFVSDVGDPNAKPVFFDL